MLLGACEQSKAAAKDLTRLVVRLVRGGVFSSCRISQYIGYCWCLSLKGGWPCHVFPRISFAFSRLRFCLEMNLLKVWNGVISALVIFTSGILGILVVSHLVLPLIVLLAPHLETPLYDLGVYGAYRTQNYVSFGLSSPRASILQWHDRCDQGFIFLTPKGGSVSHPGPMILDSKGNLVWMSDRFKLATNLKVQRYRGQEYLTFWSGEKASTYGIGVYYMVSPFHGMLWDRELNVPSWIRRTTWSATCLRSEAMSMVICTSSRSRTMVPRF